MDDDQAGRWLTYAEAGRRFGVSPEAARQLARRGWRRRMPNEPNETARIFVPDEAYVRPRTPVTGVSPPSVPPAPNGVDQAVAAENVRGVELAISTLTTQLDRADLLGANLSGADLSGAELRDAKLSGQAQLDQACGINVKLDPGLTIKPCP